MICFFLKEIIVNKAYDIRNYVSLSKLNKAKGVDIGIVICIGNQPPCL